MAFQIIRADITTVKADVIVNSANPEPGYGGGTDHAVYQAAGEEKLLKARQKIGRMEPGQAEATPAFKLNARHIIHTVAPVWQGGNCQEEEILRQCYENSLELAVKLHADSIAFPLLSAGTYGYPRTEALMTAVSVFESFLAEHEMTIILTVLDKESFQLSGKIFAGVEEFINDRKAEEKLKEEYRENEERRRREAQIYQQSRPVNYPRPSHVFMDADEAGAEEAGIFDAAPAEKTEASKKEETLFGDSQASDVITPSVRPRPKSQAQQAPGAMKPSMRPEARNDAQTAKDQYEKKNVSIFDKRREKKKRSLEDLILQPGETWQESLFRLIDEKGYSDTEVYKQANIDRKLFSKIRSNREYQPKKITAVALALSLKLNLDETRDFLRKAGYALAPGNTFDLIVEYFIEEEVYDTYTINLALFEHDQPLLGA